MFRSLKVGLASIAIAVLTVGAANGSVIDTQPGWNESDTAIGYFGVDGTYQNTEYFGQTFIVPDDNVLTSFTFSLDSDGLVDFYAYVAEWDGDKATTVHYTSALTSTTSGMAGYEFDITDVLVDGLSLISGDTYVAYLCAVAGSGYAEIGGTPDSDSYDDGALVSLEAGNEGETWNTYFDTNHPNELYDAKFLAEFVPGSSSVPEPSSLVLWCTLGGIGLVTRYRKRLQV